MEALRHRHEELEALERDRDAITASGAAAVPDDLDRLTPERRNTLYHMLRLEMRPTEEGYEITGPFVTEPLCASEPLPF